MLCLHTSIYEHSPRIYQTVVMCQWLGDEYKCRAYTNNTPQKLYFVFARSLARSLVVHLFEHTYIRTTDKHKRYIKWKQL